MTTKQVLVSHLVSLFALLTLAVAMPMAASAAGQLVGAAQSAAR